MHIVSPAIHAVKLLSRHIYILSIVCIHVYDYFIYYNNLQDTTKASECPVPKRIIKATTLPSALTFIMSVFS